MKLEAIWILINLSMCDQDEAKILLLSSFPQENQQFTCEYKMPEVLLDFDKNQSEIVSKLNRLIEQRCNENQTDSKILLLVFQFYANLSATGQEYTQKLIRESNVIQMFQKVRQLNIINAEDQNDYMESLTRLAFNIAEWYQWDTDYEDSEEADDEDEELKDMSREQQQDPRSQKIIFNTILETV